MDPDVLEWRIIGYLAYRRRNASNSYEGHHEHIQPEIARAVGKPEQGTVHVGHFCKVLTHLTRRDMPRPGPDVGHPP